MDIFVTEETSFSDPEFRLEMGGWVVFSCDSMMEMEQWVVTHIPERLRADWTPERWRIH